MEYISVSFTGRAEAVLVDVATCGGEAIRRMQTVAARLRAGYDIL